MKIFLLLFLIAGVSSSAFADEELCHVRVKLTEVGIVREAESGYATEILGAKITVISSVPVEPNVKPACALFPGRSMRSDHIVIDENDYLAAKAGKDLSGIYSSSDSEVTWSLNVP